jgi:hypothetical protein
MSDPLSDFPFLGQPPATGSGVRGHRRIGAARAGGLGLTIWVGRGAHATTLAPSHVDRVLADLSEVCLQGYLKH